MESYSERDLPEIEFIFYDALKEKTTTFKFDTLHYFITCLDNGGKDCAKNVYKFQTPFMNKAFIENYKCHRVKQVKIIHSVRDEEDYSCKFEEILNYPLVSIYQRLDSSAELGVFQISVIEQ